MRVVNKEKPVQAVPATSWAKAISMSWWEKVLSDIWGDAQNLIRVSRIDKPEASILHLLWFVALFGVTGASALLAGCNQSTVTVF